MNKKVIKASAVALAAVCAFGLCACGTGGTLSGERRGGWLSRFAPTQTESSEVHKATGELLVEDVSFDMQNSDIKIKLKNDSDKTMSGFDVTMAGNATVNGSNEAAKLDNETHPGFVGFHSDNCGGYAMWDATELEGLTLDAGEEKTVTMDGPVVVKDDTSMPDYTNAVYLDGVAVTSMTVDTVGDDQSYQYNYKQKDDGSYDYSANAKQAPATFRVIDADDYEAKTDGMPKYDGEGMHVSLVVTNKSKSDITNGAVMLSYTNGNRVKETSTVDLGEDIKAGETKTLQLTVPGVKAIDDDAHVTVVRVCSKLS